MFHITTTPLVKPSFIKWLRPSSSFLELSLTLLLTSDSGLSHLPMDNFPKYSSTWSSHNTLVFTRELVQVHWQQQKVEHWLRQSSIVSSCSQCSGLSHLQFLCAWIRWNASCIASDSIGLRCKTSSSKVMVTSILHLRPKKFWKMLRVIDCL